MVARLGLRFILAVCLLFFVAGVFSVGVEMVVAADEGIVPACPANDPNCTDPYSPDNYGTCEFVSLINNIVSFLIGIASVLAMIVFVYAGYLMVMSQGNTGGIAKAKGLFTNVLIGYVILLTAFLIVNTILSMLVGSTSSLLNWNQIQCSYAYEVGTPERVVIPLASSSVVGFDLSDSVVVNPYTNQNPGGGFVGPGGNIGGAGGTCSVVTNPLNACYPSWLSCFGARANDASMICNIESGGGNTNARSGTDLCKNGESFSGGLFQINVLAHYDKLPGCSNDFFTKVGSGVQGDCIVPKNGFPNGGYCAVRNCEIVNGPVYEECMRSTFDPDINIGIACQLFNARGGTFGDWAYSANKCGV